MLLYKTDAASRPAQSTPVCTPEIIFIIYVRKII